MVTFAVHIMPKSSRENQVLELFFNEPTKQWHFFQIMKEVPLPANKVSKWLKKFQKEGLIKRVKPRGKMPFYLACSESSHYENTKRFFAFNRFNAVGLFDYLASLEGAQAVILFGSFSRGDWYKESDIDLFIYGEVKSLNLGPFYFTLHREFQVFVGKNRADLQEMGPALLRNIIRGVSIKGSIPSVVLEYALV